MEHTKYTIFPNEHYMDLTLYQYGRERCFSAHSFGPAARNHYLFHFILNGKGKLISTSQEGDVKEYELGKNQGFLIHPGQVTTYIADADDPWEYIWLEFDGLKAKEFVDNAGFSRNQPVYKNSKREYLKPLKDEMLAIVDAEDASSPHQIGHLYLFIDLLMKSSYYYKNMTTGSLKEFYIREAIGFIERNFANPITVEDIAQFCNLNRSYLGTLFKEKLKKSPQQFLIYYRMNQAAELLCFTDLSIGEIGKSVGYPNQLHFSRAFRNVYDVPPSQWRKEHKKVNKNSL
jgi:AraC-like DNA-binding protein